MWHKLLPFSLISGLLPALVACQCSIQPLQLSWGNTTVTQDGLGVSRGIEVGIGSPNQIFAFRPSTTLNNSRINNVYCCGATADEATSNDTCVGGLGGVFDSQASSTYSVAIKAQWNGSEIDDESSTSAYVYFNDYVGFQRNGNVDGFPLVLDGQEGGGAQSSLPLGTNSSFLDATVKGGVAPSDAWGLWTGSRGVDPVDGMLVIGGYDHGRIDGEFTNFSISEWDLRRPCPLQVTVTDVTYNGQSLFANSTEKEMVACVEPNTQRNVFTPAMANAFANLTGQNSSFFKGMTYPTDQRPAGDMMITIDGKYNTTISNFELFNPFRSSDQNGRYAITNSSIVEAGVADNRKEKPDDVNPTLGGLFLTFNYLVVEYGKREFRLAPTKPREAKAAVEVRTLCTASEPTNSINKGAIAGGVVGGVSGIVFLFGLIFWLVRRRRSEGQEQPPLENNTENKDAKTEPQMVHSQSWTPTVELDSPDHVHRAELPTSAPSVRKTSRPEWLETRTGPESPLQYS